MNIARRFASSAKDGKTVVELFYDIISPYSYIQFELLVRQRSNWNSLALKCTPALLGGVLKNADNPAPVEVPAKQLYVKNDMKRLSDFHKIPFAFYPNFPEFAYKMGSLKTQRFLTAIESQLDESSYEKLIRAFFAGLFSSNSLDISKPDVIKQIAISAGVDAGLVEKGIESSGSDEVKSKLMANGKRVTEYGGFGLPTTVVHLPSRPKMVFGSDRIHIIGQMLGETKPAILYLKKMMFLRFSALTLFALERSVFTLLRYGLHQ